MEIFRTAVRMVMGDKIIKFPTRPTKNVPTVMILGDRYRLSNSMDGTEDSDDLPYEGGLGKARIIDTGGNPWRYLWVVDIDHNDVTCWRVSDGDEKAGGSANTYRRQLEQLARKGQLNEVDGSTYRALQREMEKRYQDTMEALRESIEESKTNLDRRLDGLAEQYYKVYLQFDVKRFIRDVERSVRDGVPTLIPMGFKDYEGDGITVRKVIRFGVYDMLHKPNVMSDFEEFIVDEGFDIDAVHPQDVQWALEEVLDREFNALTR